jgi:hypothetical protein
MTQTPPKSNVVSQKPNKDSLRIWRIIAILFLLITAGLLIVFLPMRGEYEVLMEEKDQQRRMIEYELNDLMAAHDSVKTEYGILADSLSAKDSVIQANAAEIKELLNYKWEYYKVNKKLNQLREITQGYVVQMDSLFTVNRELKEENEKIRQQYNREQNRTRELTRDKEELIEKVSEATVLRAYNVTAKTLRLTGSGRKRETDKAKRVERVEVCFTLGENKLAEPGTKVIFIQIIRPDGVVVTQKVGGEYTFDYKGEKVSYTAKKEVDYENKDTYTCLHWTKKSDDVAAMVGVYNVRVFTSGEEIGTASFELR